MAMHKVCGECGRAMPGGLVLSKFSPFRPKKWARIGVVGMTQTGKSRTVKEWAAYLLAHGFTVFAIDPQDEYSQHGASGPEVHLGPLKDRLSTRQFMELWRRNSAYLRRRGLGMSIVPTQGIMGEALAAELAPIIGVLRARGECVIIFEECHLYAKWMEDLLAAIAACDAKHRVIPIFVSQTAGMVPHLIRGQWSMCVSYGQFNAYDRSELKKHFGPDFAEGLGELKEGQFKVAFTRPH